MQLSDGSKVYCLWLSRDPEDVGEGGRSYANITLASSFNSTADRSMLQGDMSLGAVSTLLTQNLSRFHVAAIGQSYCNIYKAI